MFDINHTSELNFCIVPYIYNEYMSFTVSIIATSVDTEIATRNLIQIIMKLEENHKFLVIETPRSALFFNYVTSSFACPKQNKKNQLSTQKDSTNLG